MWDSVANVYRLGVKELYGFRHDAVLLALIAYALTIAVYLPAKSSLVELVDASVAVVDEDRSDLSRRIIAAFAGRSFSPRDGCRSRRSTRRRTPGGTRSSSIYPRTFRRTWCGAGVPPLR